MFYVDRVNRLCIQQAGYREGREMNDASRIYWFFLTAQNLIRENQPIDWTSCARGDNPEQGRIHLNAKNEDSESEKERVRTELAEKVKEVTKSQMISMIAARFLRKQTGQFICLDRSVRKVRKGLACVVCEIEGFIGKCSASEEGKQVQELLRISVNDVT